MLKKILYMSVLLAAMVIPAMAQQEATIELVTDTTEIIPGSQFMIDVMVKDGLNIAGADIAIAVDGTCLEVTSMNPGGYLPHDAESGGFSPMNMHNPTTARLAANITDRQHIATGDGVFMSVAMTAKCSDNLSTIDVSRAELVTVDGQQFTANFAAQDIQIGSINDMATEEVQTMLTADTNNTYLITLLAVALIIFSLLGLFSLLGWRVVRMRVQLR